MSPVWQVPQEQLQRCHALNSPLLWGSSWIYPAWRSHSWYWISLLRSFCEPGAQTKKITETKIQTSQIRSSSPWMWFCSFKYNIFVVLKSGTKMISTQGLCLTSTKKAGKIGFGNGWLKPEGPSIAILFITICMILGGTWQLTNIRRPELCPEELV